MNQASNYRYGVPTTKKGKSSSSCRSGPKLLSHGDLPTPLLPKYLFTRPPSPSYVNHHSTMIRSNPTAIPLRTSDLKLLQAELDKRRPPPESSTHPQSQQATGGSSAMAANGVNKEAYNAVEEAKKDRQGRTVAERIGL